MGRGKVEKALWRTGMFFYKRSWYKTAGAVWAISNKFFGRSI